MTNLTVIGDDLTGTVDCTSLGVRCGCEVRVEADPEKDFLPPDPLKREILGINLSSRTLPGKSAYELSRRITSKVKDGPGQIILKKLDTGFRGNAAYEIEGMLTELGKQFCFILEHIPIRKTFTLYGYQYSGGQILNKSVFARDDRLKAPTEAYIPSILAKGTDLPIGTVDIDAVKGGRLVEAVHAEIQNGKRILVFDAITAADGIRTVKTLQPLYPDAMWAGSTGIVEALITYLYGDMESMPIYATSPQCICFSGTAYNATKEQLSYTEQASGLMVLDLDIDRVLDKDESIFEEICDRALRENALGKDILIRQKLSPERDFPGVEKIILQSLSRVAGDVCPKARFDRIVVVGGETSQAIFHTLDICTLLMDDPPEIGTGIGKIGNGPYQGKSFAIKGGSIGSPAVMIKLLGKWNGISQK